MTPAEFKAARKALGLSQVAIGRALRLADYRLGAPADTAKADDKVARTVRRWEAGRDIPGPAIVAIDLMCQAEAFGQLDFIDGRAKIVPRSF